MPVKTKGELLKPNISIASGTMGQNNWYTSNVVLNINDTAQAGKTRAVAIKYSITGGNNLAEQTISATSGQVTINRDGTSTIYACVVDGEGNRSATAELTLKRDATPPSVPTVTYNGGANTCSWKNNYKINLTSTDSASGIAYYQADWHGNGSVDGNIALPWTPGNGHHSHTNIFRAVDNAGNVGNWTAAQHIHMDTEAPNVTKSWYGTVANGQVSLYIQVSDNASGVAKVQAPTSTGTGGYNNWHWYEAVWDAGANAWRADIKASDYGHYGTDYYSHIYVTDNAGNQRGVQKNDEKAYIPNTAPAIQTITYKSKTTNSITITARATDKENDALTYKMYTSTDNKNWTEKATSSSVASGNTVTLTASGLSEYTYYYIKVRATETASQGLYHENTYGPNGQVRTYCPGNRHPMQSASSN